MNVPLWTVEKIEKLCPIEGSLRKSRKQLGVGLRRFAKLAKCSPTYISRIETGKIKYVSMALAHRIGKVLDELDQSQQEGLTA